MSKFKCSDMLDKLNRIKSTCKDQSFDETGLPSILLNQGQIIANGQSRYMSIQLDHELSDSQISFDNFHQIISKFNPDSEVELVQGEAAVIIRQQAKGNRTKINLPLDTDHEIMFHESLPAISDMIPLPDDMIHAIKMCELSLPKDTSKPGYDCYNIETDKIITTDGARVSVFNLNDELTSSFMLSIKDGTSIPENNFTHYDINDGYIDLMGSDVFTRISFFINDAFPDIGEIGFDSDGKIEFDRQALLNDLSSASLFSMGSHTTSSSVNFSVSENGKYTIKSENQMGKIIARGRVKSSMSFESIINPIYLLQSFEQLNEKHVTIDVCILDDRGFRFMIKENNFTYIFNSYNS
jgi:hypothetical protein